MAHTAGFCIIHNLALSRREPIFGLCSNLHRTYSLLTKVLTLTWPFSPGLNLFRFSSHMALSHSRLASRTCPFSSSHLALSPRPRQLAPAPFPFAPGPFRVAPVVFKSQLASFLTGLLPIRACPCPIRSLRIPIRTCSRPFPARTSSLCYRRFALSLSKPPIFVLFWPCGLTLPGLKTEAKSTRPKTAVHIRSMVCLRLVNGPPEILECGEA